MEINQIYNMDCIAGMGMIPDKSVDMILCDLPYGVTHCRWDALIPFDMLWKEYIRIIKERGAIILTAIQPFTTALIQSNLKWFKYCWYWYKNQPTGFASSKYQPMRCIEDVVVFYKNAPTYNPQGLIKLESPIYNKADSHKSGGIYRTDSLNKPYITEFTHYPRNLLQVPCERGLHPTQKPVALFEYLIRTYTNHGELVLDNCMGSGTTAVACLRSDRKYIGFELDNGYCEVARGRIEKTKEQERR